MSTSQSQDDPRLTERICLVRFAYHLWRVDTAARAFAGLDKKQVDSMETMKKRWEIGLVLEIVCSIQISLVFHSPDNHTGRLSSLHCRCMYARLHDNHS